MVLHCGLQEETFTWGEASLERKQVRWLHRDANTAWTPSKDPPSLATQQLQELPSSPVCVEQRLSLRAAGTRSPCRVLLGRPCSRRGAAHAEVAAVHSCTSVF